MDIIKVKKAGPWLWIPTLYFAEGLPYFIVNTIALAVFKDMGLDNGTLGLVTTIISLPWLIKPFWSPFVDIFRSKRWWILSMQVAMAVAVLLVALLLPVTSFTMILILFLVVAFASATHDIAADGFYMLALDPKNQSAFVGVRSTFYRIASVFGPRRCPSAQGRGCLQSLEHRPSCQCPDPGCHHPVPFHDRTGPGRRCGQP